ncbi:hypothetical protein SHKM778_34260 [Streptomyces sp. KM77-8]|uniref:Transposase n=1 Tax=Streptomyces haneummycinicus TaxID=3074435 RepID=A0AAT9HHY8_9ACTN
MRKPDARRPCSGGHAEASTEIVTTIRREVLTLPAALLGPDNPLPPLRPLDETHRVEDRDKRDPPRDTARQIGYEPLRGLLPVPVRDGYDRHREPRTHDTLVIENDRLRATVLPTLGGRICHRSWTVAAS